MRSPIDGGKRDSAPRKREKLKPVAHLSAKLGCQRCTAQWTVIDLNSERKVVPCPTCGEQNDIRESIKRAA